MNEQRRLQLTGLHHVTAICSDAERTIAFYRDLLGLGIVRDGHSDDDPESRHVWFGVGSAQVSFMEYPELPPGTTGVGATHHFALMVASADELQGWADYLKGRDVEATAIMERAGFRSIYIRDPDGHLVEIAAQG
jgi:glyoxylase I family protein